MRLLATSERGPRDRDESPPPGDRPRRPRNGSGGAAIWRSATSRASPVTACSTSTAACAPTTSSRSPRRSPRAWRAYVRSSTGSRF